MAQRKMAERNNGEWQFYSTEPPSPSVVRDFVAEMDEGARQVEDRLRAEYVDFCLPCSER